MFTRCDHCGDRSQLQLSQPLTCNSVCSVSHELNMFNSYDRPCNCRTDYANWGQSHWPAKWCDTWNVEQTLKLIEIVKNDPIFWQTDHKEHGRKAPCNASKIGPSQPQEWSSQQHCPDFICVHYAAVQAIATVIKDEQWHSTEHR